MFRVPGGHLSLEAGDLGRNGFGEFDVAFVGSKCVSHLCRSIRTCHRRGRRAGNRALVFAFRGFVLFLPIVVAVVIHSLSFPCYALTVFACLFRC